MGWESGAIAVYNTTTGGWENGATAIYQTTSGGWKHGATAVYRTTTGGWENGAMAVYRTTTGGWENGAMLVYYVGCFPASELVQISETEYAPIGSVKIGDKISAWDVENRKQRNTSVIGVNQYIVNEMVCINGSLCVSASHPLLVMGETNNLHTAYWKIAGEVSIGDCLIASNGESIAVYSKTKHWYDDGIEVINIATDNGEPFVVRNCIVRADNANDSLMRVNALVSRQMRLLNKVA